MIYISEAYPASTPFSTHSLPHLTQSIILWYVRPHTLTVIVYKAHIYIKP